MNVFDALNIMYREDTISDFLVNCFRDSSLFLREFLNRAEITTTENTHFSINERVGLGKGIGTPDIIICATTNNQVSFIVIENKMGAVEGKEQTNRYESLEAKTRIASRFNAEEENSEFYFIFLALDSTVRPKNSQFAFLNYSIFLHGDWQLHNKTLQYLMNDFQQKLHHFYEPLKQPYQSLECNEQMDNIQRKICWQTILHEKFYTYKEFLLDWGETGGSGRSNFLFLISKRNWKSSESFQDEGLLQTFNIHIDTYVNMLDSKEKQLKEIGVRFETFPYKPHRQINKLPNYEAFVKNKADFGQKLVDKSIQQGLPVKAKGSKLLVLSISVEADSIRETIENIKKHVLTMEKIIDEVVEEMKEVNILK
ncbi:PD-(D/E)XK nuclease family protein [Gracilibacillus sp. S3-1-1]|uniref:PD-(D/E)XK nuclease family protein n=1 Tax=Gracilibacillus pellucidus TaxID=3095368 RepID=A0ACC6M8M2_9BACI|nr:PD-(D/E)XK nuclease family protein [Gracilibacillus sp. S3-1-1]MDX8047192.1 PD-(D/E)XK nuclease family protein [Gracilibacillus sp. S3-1-1]